MKLVNFASMNPAQQARGVKGLPGHSRADEQVWNEFRSHWDQMAFVTETTLARLEAPEPMTKPEADFVPPDVETEMDTKVKVRTMQSFFRKVVLAAYNSKCCITGNPVEDLLVASHIPPWSEFPQERLNPKNGLLPSGTFRPGI